MINIQHQTVINFTPNKTLDDPEKIISSIEILTEKPKPYFEKLERMLLSPISMSKSLVGKLITPMGLADERVKEVNEDFRDSLLKMGGEEVHFKFEERHTIEGMFFKNKIDPSISQKTIILCTGSHLSYENYAAPLVREFLSMGHQVLTFNYEGFGKSEGSSSEKGVYDSTEAAFQYLKQIKKYGENSIIAWGYSLGSGAVTELATEHHIDIVLDRGFSSLGEVAYRKAPTYTKTLAKFLFNIGLSFNNIHKLPSIKGRVLIAQGSSDETMVKEDHGLKLKEAGKEKCEYMEVDSRHEHGFYKIWFDQEHANEREKIAHFLDSSGLDAQ